MGFPLRQKVIIIKETITQHRVLFTPHLQYLILPRLSQQEAMSVSALIIMQTFLSISALPTKVLCIYFAEIILILGEVFWVFDLNVC